ncbi:MAG: peptidylprolyl isomerase [Mariniphaga sp.]
MKKKYPAILFVTLWLTTPLFAQNNDILVTIGQTEINLEEFERIYRKNNQNLLDETEVKSPEDYLDLFIRFKLKVEEALALKMDTIQSFRDELASYRKQLAAPYLTDMKYDEALIHDLYQRMTKEVNASHILFRVHDNAGTDEKMEVYQKALQVKKEIEEGKLFITAALEYSEDPSTQQNQGNLGYFTAFQMVAPFENAAFNTPVGKISEPIRTSFGYHLIQVHDLRENRGEIKVAHIMKMFPQDVENFDKNRIKTEIDSIYLKLKQGADFAEMAKKYSDDKQSAVQGGEMPWFAAGNMIPEFAEPAFNLKNVGDISEPVETMFGYHIIKKISQRPVPPLTEVREEIENRIKRDAERSTSTKKAFIEKLKKEYHYTEYKDNLSKIGTLNINSDTKADYPLFTFNNKEYPLTRFKSYLQKQNIETGTYTQFFEEWSDEEIIAYEDSQLEEKHPDFRYLMQEYHDGLLLFNIMEEKIWSFAVEDSTGLEKFYAKNNKTFHWEERFNGVIINCKDSITRIDANNYISAGMNLDEIDQMVNQEENKIQFEHGSWEKGDNKIVDYYIWNEPEPADFNPNLTFVKGNVIPPEPKTLDEARGLYISEYQDFLEKKWLKSLKKKYKVKVNKKLLKLVSDV